MAQLRPFKSRRPKHRDGWRTMDWFKNKKSRTRRRKKFARKSLQINRRRAR